MLKCNKLRRVAGVLLAVLVFSGCQIQLDWEQQTTSTGITLDDLPEYSGEAYVPVNGNVPYFADDDYTTEPFELYADLDALGRCGVAYANICTDLMPTEQRGDISKVKPTGWHSGTDINYNRCHLIAFQLAGENANKQNLITGTRQFNLEMLTFENMVADYVKETENHVLYRVTPIYDGDDLVAKGVLMEGYSVEDAGEGILYCVFVYNVQDGATIDYATGEGWLDGKTPAGEQQTYVLNTGSKRFHLPECKSIAKMKAENKSEYTGTRAELIEQGYEACKDCKP